MPILRVSIRGKFILIVWIQSPDCWICRDLLFCFHDWMMICCDFTNKKATADMPPNTTIALVQECFFKVLSQILKAWRKKHNQYMELVTSSLKLTHTISIKAFNARWVAPWGPSPPRGSSACLPWGRTPWCRPAPWAAWWPPPWPPRAPSPRCSSSSAWRWVSPGAGRCCENKKIWHNDTMCPVLNSPELPHAARWVLPSPLVGHNHELHLVTDLEDLATLNLGHVEE